MCWVAHNKNTQLKITQCPTFPSCQANANDGGFETELELIQHRQKNGLVESARAAKQMKFGLNVVRKGRITNLWKLMEERLQLKAHGLGREETRLLCACCLSVQDGVCHSPCMLLVFAVCAT
jgi:hypothetical protein